MLTNFMNPNAHQNILHLDKIMIDHQIMNHLFLKLLDQTFDEQI